MNPLLKFLRRRRLVTLGVVAQCWLALISTMAFCQLESVTEGLFDSSREGTPSDTGNGPQKNAFGGMSQDEAALLRPSAPRLARIRCAQTQHMRIAAFTRGHCRIENLQIMRQIVTPSLYLSTPDSSRSLPLLC